MTGQTSTGNVDILHRLQEHLLTTKTPFILPDVIIDSVKLSASDFDGMFFDIIHPAPNLIDIIIGSIQGDPIGALMVAVAVKMEFLRFAKPLLRGYHYDKVRLWEKGLLTPEEIVKKVEEDLSNLFIDLDFNVHFFYGRLNTEYNTMTYVSGGEQASFYYNKKKNQVSFLGSKNAPLGKTPRSKRLESAQLMFSAGDYMILNVGEARKDYKGEKYSQLSFLLKEHANLHILDLMPKLKLQLKNTDDSSLFLVLKTAEEKQSYPCKYTNAKFASDLSQLQAVRTFIRRVCEQTPGDSEKLSLQLQLVINEIFCNIVKHSYHNLSKGEIVVESQIVDDGIYLTISDKGKSFNPVNTKYPNLAGDQENGFGFFIIQQIADHITYSPKTSTDEWNHLRIFKSYFFQEDQMEFSHEIKNNVLVIVPRGDSLDAKTAPAFKESVLDLIRSSGLSRLVFDLSNLQFIDSSGLGTFLSIQRMLNTQGGLLKLAHLSKPVRTMFEIVSMHRIFDIFNKVEEATNSF
jgi:anti-anti-sigma factor